MNPIGNKSIAELTEELALVKSKLAKKEALFNSITEHTLAGYWIWDIPKNQMFISPHLKAMLGYKDDELPNSVETINLLMHPSDLPCLLYTSPSPRDRQKS